MTSQAEPRLWFTTESPDQPTLPTSVGSTMSLNVPTVAAFSASEGEKLEEAEKFRREAALRRASGPYLTAEAVKIDWFAQPHPAPWMRWVLMTPEIASYILREHNDDNRPLRPNRVNHYKKVILRGEWHLTHQGVAMDSRGILQDGQHRLAAILEAGKERDDMYLEVPVAFFVGMDPQNFYAIDEGLNRTPGDLFAKGGVKYGPVIAAAIRLAIAFADKSPRGMMRERRTNEEILTFYASNDPQELQDAAKFGATNWKKAYATTAPLAAAYYLLRQRNGFDNNYVAAFLEGFVTGRKAGTRIALDDDDPRAVTRRYFEKVRLGNRRLHSIEALGLIVAAWNNIVVGERPRFARLADNTPIPSIIVCADSGPGKSACPEALQGEIEESE